MAKKENYNEEDLNVEDKLQEVSDSEAYMEKMKKSGTIILIASVIVIGLFAWYYYDQKQKEEMSNEAALALSKILSTYTAEDYELALEGRVNPDTGKELLGLKDISKRYSGTEQSYTAAMYAGNALLKLGKYEESKEYFEDAASAEIDIIKLGAYAGIGFVNENMEKYNDAAVSFEKAAEYGKEENIKQRYLFYAAVNYEEAGDIENAKTIYEKIVAKDEITELGGMAKSALVRLGTKFD